MTDPVEIMARAMMDARFFYASAEYKAELWRLNSVAFLEAERTRIAALEAAGYRLLSAEGVTEEMAKPIEEIMMDLFDGDLGSRRMISAERKLQIAKSVATKVLRAAPLFGNRE